MQEGRAGNACGGGVKGKGGFAAEKDTARLRPDGGGGLRGESRTGVFVQAGTRYCIETPYVHINCFLGGLTSPGGGAIYRI